MSAGSIPGTFSVTSMGEARFVLPLQAPPGRENIEPSLAVAYSSSAGDGVLGVGFSLSGGASAITRCPKTLAQDSEVRSVRYDRDDKLCLDGKPLVVIQRESDLIEYRTLPDTFTKVIGHELDAEGTPRFFEAFEASGLVIEYGTDESSRALGPDGVPRAWLAAVAHDGRGNAMTYGYCFADTGEYTAEYALDEIRYTRFDGSPSLEATRAVKLVYGIKDISAVRTVYSGGMELQSSLRLDAVQMVGPGEELVRTYAFHYAQSPTTNRTRLTQVEECAGDGVCKPPTRFEYQTPEIGFRDSTTQVSAPTSLKASPLLADIDGDGLVDLVVPDTDKALSTPQNPLTQWSIAHNRFVLGSPSPLASPKLAFSQEGSPVQDPDEPADSARIQPEIGTPIDYDQDGRSDILLHDVRGASVSWRVLLAQPDQTFKVLDTGIPRPFPLGSSPKPPDLVSKGGSMHLADVNGDHVPDLIQCVDHGSTAEGDPSKAIWMLYLWRPAQGGTAAGFDPHGEEIERLARMPCHLQFSTVDLDSDGKVDLVIDTVFVTDDGSEVVSATFDALTRLEDGSWEEWSTGLLVPDAGGRVVFLDVNGDGLPDAVESGAQDEALYTYINTGRSFGLAPLLSLGDKGLGGQDLYFNLATVLDYNGDGRQDILVPMPPEMLPDSGDVPAWVILQANGGMQADATFTMVDPKVPFEAALGEAVTLADPRGPRTADVTGDGASDLLLPLGGVFHVFEGLAADPDTLVAIKDGMNAHDPTDADYVPNVHLTYGHLIDTSITDGLSASDPAADSHLYLSRADASNDCAYPRRCAVGSRRVVAGYALNDGEDGERRFEVRYRDGRTHQRGDGFLGFVERTIVDLDTGAVTADFYDNVTFDDERGVFPFVAQLQRQWRASPGLVTQPDPDKIEISYLDIRLDEFPTNEGKTHFTLPTQGRLRKAQGAYSPGGSGQSLEAYLREVEQGGGGATWLRDTTTKIMDVDDFGHPRHEEIATAGVDFTLKIDRTFKNDTDRWVLGQLQTQKECSSAAMKGQCRTLTRTTTVYGEVESESIADDEGSPDTKLDVVYGRDAFGNITSITADDAFGHHRTSEVVYESDGIFPREHTNAAKHTTFTEVDPGLGVLRKYTDPNGLITEWRYDGFGRPVMERRPDGTTTTHTLTRTKDGGPEKDAWRVRQRATTTGGADDEVELDSLGREVRRWWHGPAIPGSNGEPPRLLQVTAYDRWSGGVARRSVPVREDTAESALLFDTFERDSLGREVRHIAPWSAVTETTYDGLLVHVTDPQNHTTTVQLDALDRRVTVTDAEQGVTSYTYAPFGWLFTVTGPDGAITRRWRDAMGRVRKSQDPDRGTTTLVHDGFGELLSSTDALGRTVTFEPDALGRTKTRTDQLGADIATTTWTWDTAAHGIGKLHSVESPDGEKTYTYTALGQMESLTLDVTGEIEAFTGKLGYDNFGRVTTVSYPRPLGMPAFVVAQDYDAYGHVFKVRDASSGVAYWQLTDVDNAGRYRREAFGDGVSTTERSYDDARQRLRSLETRTGATKVQSLEVDYDALNNLESRTDALQPTHTTERFRYDALERLKCSYFSALEDPSAPCETSYEYAPNGNLTFKSDVGILSYGDPAHPHAVTAADNDSYAYDAVGNQITRPGGVTVSYTPFDLPRTITEGANEVTFGYDGDEQRIRKTTPKAETLYFEGWYERVTPMGAGPTEHRYYVRSPERVVAIVTRGGPKPGTLYVHADHLGSVDAVTDAAGNVVERRSYDAFGQRRNPEWGAPPPPSFTGKTTLGFTGHEDDGEVGLVNMKGRVYDPKLGRFLTTDPIIFDVGFGQAFNPYTYVRNNPLSYVDPTGWQEAPEKPPLLPDNVIVTKNPDGSITIGLHYPKGRPERKGPDVPTTDTDPTGSQPPPQDPPDPPEEPNPDEPDDWTQNPYLQGFGGFLGGLGLGVVPFAGVGEQVLEDGGVLGHGTPAARRGLAAGQVLGGIFTMVGGLAGEVLGGAATVTGIGALIGVPAMVVSTTLVVGGAANVMAGLNGLMQSMSTGSGSSGSRRPSAGVRREADRKATGPDGKQRCQHCGAEVTEKAGSPNSKEYDHRDPYSRSKDSSSDNIDVTCRTCNRQKGARTPDEWGGPQKKEP